MKKFFWMLFAVMATVMSLNAQTTYEGSKFFDNTYARVTGGATGLVNPSTLGYDDFGHSVQAVVGAEIGKWITPNFGVALAGDFGIRNGSKCGLFQYEDDFGTQAGRFNYITVTGLVKGNLSNIFGGYKTRAIEFVVATGPMWIHGYPGKQYINDFGVKFQGEMNVNVTNRLQINVVPELNYNLTGLYSYGTYEHPRFDSRNAWVGLQVGATYKFGKQFTACPYRYTQAQYDALIAEVNDLRAREPQVVEKVVEKVIEKKVFVNQTVYVVAFDYGSDVLDANAKDVLNKVPADVNVVVHGEASYPGSEAYNQKLSQRRADNAANYLKGRGVNVVGTEALGETGHQIVTVIVK